MTEATGTFDVHMLPQTEDATAGATLGRMSLNKQFYGDLVAMGTGEMLTASTVTGSAVYVALERVVGTLHARSGTFVLVHHGTITAQSQHLTISVMPNSGTDQLTGLAGELAITIVDGQHTYNFNYMLAPETA